MAQELENYEDIRAFAIDEAREQELLNTATECVFMWTTKSGEPVGVVHSFVADRGRIWLTAAEQRARIPALRRDPRCCICVNSTGTSMGGGKTVTYKGLATLHKGDRALSDWYYRALAERLYGAAGPGIVDSFIEFLDSPARVIIEFTITKKITFDGDKMAAATPWLKSGWRAT